MAALGCLFGVAGDAAEPVHDSRIVLPEQRDARAQPSPQVQRPPVGHDRQKPLRCPRRPHLCDRPPTASARSGCQMAAKKRSSAIVAGESQGPRTVDRHRLRPPALLLKEVDQAVGTPPVAREAQSVCSVKSEMARRLAVTKLGQQRVDPPRHAERASP